MARSRQQGIMGMLMQVQLLTPPADAKAGGRHAAVHAACHGSVDQCHGSPHCLQQPCLGQLLRAAA